ncbi:MAG: DUF4369 domain-containing protein [Bacteroidales bacterium]|nr:DUF4369 domain-containing protein [Bacteroidales bacterium]
MLFKKLLYLSALSIALAACGDKGYIIKGDIIDLDEGTISLLDVYGHTISTTEVVDGKFTLKGKVDVPCLAYINNALGVVYPIDIPVLLENTVINVTGDARIGHIDITGTKANEDMVEFKVRKDALRPDDNEGYLNLVKEMFERDSDNVLGALLISNFYNLVSDKELLGYCDRLSPEFHDDPMVLHYKKVCQARVDTEPGKKFKDIEMKGTDSVAVKLSDVVSAHEATVLLFWASWAREVSTVLPELVAGCLPYKDKGLTMYTVSLDSDMERLAKATAEYGLFGNCFAEGTEKGDKAAGLYGFEGLPRMVLIGRDGTILARGRSFKDVSEKLGQLF